MALAVVYFISVLMVSKYRDILEPQREIGRSTSLSGRSIRHEINSPTSTGDLSFCCCIILSVILNKVFRQTTIPLSRIPRKEERKKLGGEMKAYKDEEIAKNSSFENMLWKFLMHLTQRNTILSLFILRNTHLLFLPSSLQSTRPRAFLIETNRPPPPWMTPPGQASLTQTRASEKRATWPDPSTARRWVWGSGSAWWGGRQTETVTETLEEVEEAQTCCAVWRMLGDHRRAFWILPTTPAPTPTPAKPRPHPYPALVKQTKAST